MDEKNREPEIMESTADQDKQKDELINENGETEPRDHSPAAPEADTRLWSSIKLAIKGSDMDFTEAKLGRALLLLAIPMVLEMIMESIFAVVDIFFVSKLGAHATSAVGITESMMTIIYALGFGLSIGTTAMVSRRIGEKKPKEAAVTAVQAIFSGLGVSLILSLPAIFFAKDLLQMMGAEPETVAIGSSYTAIMLGSNGLIMLLFIINAIFRSAGDAAISMRVLWLANIINIILDPCLIFGLGPFPELGVKGAAIATCIGRGLAVAYQFYLLFKGRARVKVAMDQFKANFKVMKQLLKVSMGGIGQALISTTSWVGLVRIIAEFGSEVLAGYTIAIRVIIFALLPSWGLSNAASTLMGQNLGAKRPERAERAVWITSFTNMALLGIVGVILIIFSETVLSFFTQEAAVVATGTVALRWISFGFLAYAIGMVMVQAFNGAGDTATPTKINFFCFWMFEIPLAWLLAMPMKMEEKGVYLAIILAETLMTAAGIIIFRKGRWKTREI